MNQKARFHGGNGPIILIQTRKSQDFFPFFEGLLFLLHFSRGECKAV
jgi:hypothetical protein